MGKWCPDDRPSHHCWKSSRWGCQKNEKEKNFNKDLEEGHFSLLYPDGSEVVNIPGTQRPFILEEYKAEMGLTPVQIQWSFPFWKFTMSSKITWSLGYRTRQVLAACRILLNCIFASMFLNHFLIHIRYMNPHQAQLTSCELSKLLAVLNFEFNVIVVKFNCTGGYSWPRLSFPSIVVRLLLWPLLYYSI